MKIRILREESQGSLLAKDMTIPESKKNTKRIKEPIPTDLVDLQKLAPAGYVRQVRAWKIILERCGFTEQSLPYNRFSCVIGKTTIAKLSAKKGRALCLPESCLSDLERIFRGWKPLSQGIQNKKRKVKKFIPGDLLDVQEPAPEGYIRQKEGAWKHVLSKYNLGERDLPYKRFYRRLKKTVINRDALQVGHVLYVPRSRLPDIERVFVNIKAREGRG